MGTGAEIALVATAIGATAASTAYSAQQAHKQNKLAKREQRRAEAIQKEQEAEALATRKEQIDQQREGLYQRYKTKTTETPQASGLTGRLENDILG